jgi:hypothetical protein
MSRFWTTIELKRFRERYPYSSQRDLCAEFRRTASALKNMAIKLRLGKSPLFVPVQFPKGHRPWNAGKKGWQAGGKAKLTQFKKGHRGARQRPVGAERVGRDGIEVKVAEPNEWKIKTRFVWEKHFGAIPDGAIVRLVGHDIVPENLELIDRAENARRNAVIRRPRSIKPGPLWTQLLR